MQFDPVLHDLMQALRCLPGVGQKTAQRMAFHLLERDRQGAFNLAQSLADAVDKDLFRQLRVYLRDPKVFL